MLLSTLALLFIVAFVLLRPGASIILSFLLISFSWKLVSVLYIDANAPVHSEQLGLYVGGGNSASFFGMAMILTMLPFWFVLNTGLVVEPRLSTAVKDRHPRLNSLARHVVFIAVMIFVGLLYVDLMSSGEIPLLAGMERYDYARNYAGPTYFPLFKYGQLLMAVMGGCIVYPKLKGAPYDLRFFLPISLIFAYCFLVGIRFSAYYAFITFLAIPFGALLIIDSNSKKNSAIYRNLPLRLCANKTLLMALSLVFITLIATALGNSYYQRATRAIAGDGTIGISQQIASKLVERIFIQQGELWSETWQRVNQDGYQGGLDAARFILVEPGLQGGDTGIRYIMQKAIGEAAEEKFHNDGRQFSGGYPETLFEMFGKNWGWLMILVCNVLVALLLRLGVVSFIRGRPFTAFFTAYIYFAITAMYTSGTFTFLVATTFWIKVLLLMTFYLVETELMRRGKLVAP